MTSPRQQITASGVQASKRFGQHFLQDAAILEGITHLAEPLENMHVVEIGPGPGTLTTALLASDAASITAIELDQRCLPHLEKMQQEHDGRLKIISADALTQDITALSPEPRCIVANLPYNVGTALLTKWLDQIYEQGPSAAAHLTLMFQKEVAQRIAAQPGEKHYGRLAVLSRWLCDVQYGFDVPPDAFIPPPKVTSAVIRLTPRPQPLYDVTKQQLEQVTKSAFSQRRKMLRSSLKACLSDVEGVLLSLGIDPTRRPRRNIIHRRILNDCENCSPKAVILTC